MLSRVSLRIIDDLIFKILLLCYSPYLPKKDADSGSYRFLATIRFRFELRTQPVLIRHGFLNNLKIALQWIARQICTVYNPFGEVKTRFHNKSATRLTSWPAKLVCLLWSRECIQQNDCNLWQYLRKTWFVCEMASFSKLNFTECYRNQIINCDQHLLRKTEIELWRRLTNISVGVSSPRLNHLFIFTFSSKLSFWRDWSSSELQVVCVAWIWSWVRFINKLEIV